MVSYFAGGRVAVVPTLTRQAGSTDTAARRREESSSSGSRQCQDVTVGLCSKSVFEPMPAPTSSTSPRTQRPMEWLKYDFQCRAAANSSSSVPAYVAPSSAIGPAPQCVRSCDEHAVVARRNDGG